MTDTSPTAATTPDQATPLPARNSSRFGVLAELALVIAVMVGSKLIFDRIVWTYAGPLSLLCTFTLLLVITRLRRESWSNFGLVKLRRWWSWPLIIPQALLGFAAIGLIGAGTAFLGDALGFWSTDTIPEGVEARFGNVVGNLPVYLGWIALSWISAGFGEEVFFRGYMINRAGKFFPKAWWGTAFAVLLPAIGFGIVHMYYQGLRGLVVTGMIGLALGTLYILYKRNIWPLVIAHGAFDTLTFTAFYLDLDV